MKTNAIFNAVMDVLWDNAPDLNSLGGRQSGFPEPGKVARALASYVKNHRVNAENGFEVLALLWPEASMSLRRDAEQFDHDDRSTAWFDVKFEDGSQVLLIATRGIASQLEII